MSKWGFAAWVALAATVNAAPVQQLWEKRFNGPAAREDVFSALAVDAGGRVYVTGSSDNNVNPDPYGTIKYDTNGNQLWVARYTGPRAIDVPLSVIVDGQGYVYVTGFSHGFASGYDPDYATIKYAPEGTELWVARYNGAGTNNNQTPDNPAGMVVNAAGEVYVTGTSMSVDQTLDFATIKYNTNGTELWIARYNGSASLADHATGLGIDAAGNIYVCGASQRDDYRQRVTLLKYSPAGTLLWETHFETDEADGDLRPQMKVDPSGNAHIAFAARSGTTEDVQRIVALRYNAAGELVWRTQHRVFRPQYSTEVVAVELDDGGNMCVAIRAGSIAYHDYLVWKITGSGQPLWTSRYNSPANYQDVLGGMALDAEGNIYVTGTTYLEGNRYQFTTIKLRPNGQREWETTTTHVDNFGLSLSGVRVDAAGHVYVGGSAGPVAAKDYVTIKYRQLPQPGLPQITAHPEGANTIEGGSATFAVTATGEGLEYQWHRDGYALPGATNSMLVLTNIGSGAHGYYYVEVSNIAGTVASTEALLDVIVPPEITEQPASAQVVAGSSVQFRVTVTGSEPLSFQWLKDGAAIAGATNASLLLQTVRTADAGIYAVVVTNIAGSVTSTGATLSLVPGLEQLFASTFREAGQSYTHMQSLRVGTDGKAHLAQTVQLPSRTEFLTVQFATNGAVTWSARYAAGTNQNNYVVTLEIDASNNLYVAGNTSNDRGRWMSVVKYGRAGNQLWAWGHEPSRTNSYDELVALAVDSAGNVYVTGGTANGNDPGDALTVKLDAGGTVQWAARQSMSESSYDVGNAIQVDASGVYVFGLSHHETAKLITLKYDHAGTLLWTRTYDAGYDARAAAMRLDAGGNVIVTGSATPSEGDTDFVTIKYSPAGDVVWLAKYTGMLDGYDYPYALELDGSGNVYVAGVSSLPEEENTSLSAFTIVKYDTNGNQLWVSSQIAAASAGGADSFRVDAAGNAYALLGKYHQESGSDLVTSKYDPSGTRLWEAVATRPRYGDEYPGGVAFTPEGDLVISGISYSPTSELLLFRYKQGAIVGLPVITQAPQSRDVRFGTSVSFSVTASGASSYQWYFNGRAIGGATASTYTVANATEERAGHYAVEVRNGVGAVLSPTAVLSIGVPPEITRQPYGQSVLPGSDVRFEVEALGSRPLSYQWRHNGTNIPGALGFSLELLNVQPENQGLYSVVVSNRAGVVTSVEVLLTVTRHARREWVSVFESLSRPVDMELHSTNVYVAGNGGGAPAGYLTAKFSSTGEQLWAQRFALDFSPDSYASAMAVDLSGNAYTIGDSVVSNSARGVVIVKYDSNGSQIWTRGIARAFQWPEDQDITVSHSGNIYVAAVFRSAAGIIALVTAKYDTNGVQLWSASYPLPAFDPDGRCKVAAHSDDEIFVVAQTWGSGRGYDIITLKYNGTGTQVWSRDITDPGHQKPVDLRIDPAGDPILVADSWGSYTNTGFLTVKYRATDGEELWRRVFSFSGSQNDEPFAMEVDYTRNIYVTGKAFVGSYYDEYGSYHEDEDVLTIKYSPAGDLLWVATYGAPAGYADTGASIAWDGDRGLYITGTTENEQRYTDWLTLRYDTDGNRYWSDIYEGPDGGHDSGMVARARFGDAYVLGETTAGGGYSRLGLIRYTDSGVDELPRIDTPPQSQVAIAGTNVMLSVVASGAGPLRYQWYHNGKPIIGANGAGLLLPGVESTNGGRYFVEVSNEAGVVSSADALLSVVIPARIISGPVDQCVVAGSLAQFWIEVEGDCCMGVRWYHNGVALNDFDTVVRINSVGATNAGVYTVVVTNAYGSATASARLIVTPQATVAWAARFNSTNSAHDAPNAAAVDTNGNTYVLGVAGIVSVTVKFDSSGALLWQRSNVPSNSFAVTELALSPDEGSVYVAGWAPSPLATGHLLTLAKYAANGDRLWATNYLREDYPRPVDMKVDGAGNVVITAEAGPDRYTPSEILTLKFDSDGNILWAARGNWSAETQDIPVALTLDAAGNVYVAGYTVEPDSIEYEPVANYVTVKYNAEGEELWVAEHSGPGEADDRPRAIAVDGQGNVYVTGKHSHEYWVNSGTTVYFDYDYATIKYDTNGQRLWLAVYSSAPRQQDEAADLKVDAAGNVYVFGMSDGEFVTVKYNAAGQQQWVSRVDTGFGYGLATGLVLDDATNLYITGQSYGDILTCKLDANGSRLWMARHDGPGAPGMSGSFDYPVSIGIDAGRNVYVVGSVDSQQTSRDFIVLRYSSAASPGSPVITVTPQNTSVDAGSTATLSVTATGDAPLRYQWRWNGWPLPQQTNATLHIPAVSATDAGQYSVLVYNDIDWTVSAEATLTVVMPGAVQCVHVEHVGTTTRLTIAGPAACTYQVECSPDMVSWHTLGTVYNSSGTCQYVDDTPRVERRFYRVLKLPY